MERTRELAADGLRWLREGGCVDLTAGKPVTLLAPSGSCEWLWPHDRTVCLLTAYNALTAMAIEH